MTKYQMFFVWKLCLLTKFNIRGGKTDILVVYLQPDIIMRNARLHLNNLFLLLRIILLSQPQ